MDCSSYNTPSGVLRPQYQYNQEPNSSSGLECLVTVTIHRMQSFEFGKTLTSRQPPLPQKVYVSNCQNPTLNSIKLNAIQVEVRHKSSLEPTQSH